jgi:hypothetical protein
MLFLITLYCLRMAVRAAEAPLSLTFTMCGTNVPSITNMFAQAASKPRLQTDEPVFPMVGFGQDDRPVNSRSEIRDR